MILENQTAIVTGAGAGLGRGIALAFAREGARLVLADISPESGQEILDAIRAAGGTAIFVPGDVADPDYHLDLVAQAKAKFGRLDIAVNNAGISHDMAPVADIPIETWNRVIAIDLSGVFYGVRAQIPALLEAGGGAIVNMASVGGTVGSPGLAPYCSAKHGVIGLTKTIALDYAERGIRANAVGPGFIKTDLINFFPPEERAKLDAIQPIGRMGEVHEVAELVLWLASPKSSFVTGAFYPVDGGTLAR
ncbi:MAG: SDR family NAD(P)-dependent oxidoreductase [Nitrosomonas ureae]